MRRRIFFSGLATSTLLLSTLTLLSQGSSPRPSPGAPSKERKGEFSTLNKTSPPQDEVEEADAYSLSISMTKTVFSSGEGAKVVAKIQNRTGHRVNLKDLHAVGFYLSKRGKDAERGRLHELFSAPSPLNDRLVDNYESFEFEVDLTALEWSDSASSNFDLTSASSRAISRAVPAGDYYLFMDISLPAKNSTKEDPRITSIESNEIPVKWLGGHTH